MTMFPNKKRFLFSIKNDGWEDLGEATVPHTDDKFHFAPKYVLHSYCANVAHIGKEDGKLFRFCPNCMVKIT